MNTKRWVLASLATVVVIMVFEFIIHGILLSGIYTETATVWRTQSDMQSRMWMMWLGYVIFAPVFVYIYTQGYAAGRNGLQQGVRYGLLMGVALSAMQSLGWYVVLPIPGMLAFYWFLAGMAEFTAAGVAVGIIYRE
jgi:hypothetical protein